MSKYTNCQAKKKYARYRIFGFPWGGGGSTFYPRWHRHLPDHIEIYGVRLPGRESRSREAPCNDLETLMKDLTKGLLPLLKEKPFIFMGHSYGALLSFEMSRYLLSNHHMQPEHIIVSGTMAPFSPLRRELRPNWLWSTEEEFEVKVQEYGITPPELMADKPKMRAMMANMRADIEVCCKYGDQLAPAEPYISCPITFFDGEDDLYKSPEEWAAATSSKEFYSELCPGGHFFLMEERNTRKICDYIAKKFPAL